MQQHIIGSDRTGPDWISNFYMYLLWLMILQHDVFHHSNLDAFIFFMVPLFGGSNGNNNTRVIFSSFTFFFFHVTNRLLRSPQSLHAEES